MHERERNRSGVRLVAAPRIHLYYTACVSEKNKPKICPGGVECGLDVQLCGQPSRNPDMGSERRRFGDRGAGLAAAGHFNTKEQKAGSSAASIKSKNLAKMQLGPASFSILCETAVTGAVRQ